MFATEECYTIKSKPRFILPKDEQRKFGKKIESVVKRGGILFEESGIVPRKDGTGFVYHIYQNRRDLSKSIDIEATYDTENKTIRFFSELAPYIVVPVIRVLLSDYMKVETVEEIIDPELPDWLKEQNGMCEVDQEEIDRVAHNKKRNFDLDLENAINDMTVTVEDSEFLIKGLQMPADKKLDVAELVGLTVDCCCGPCCGDDILEEERVYPYELLLPQSSFVVNLLKPFSVENLKMVHYSRRSKKYDQAQLNNKFNDVCKAWSTVIDFLCSELPRSTAIVRLQAAYKEIREGLSDQIQFCRMEFCLMEGHAEALKALNEIMLSIATEYKNKEVNTEPELANSVAEKVVEKLKNKGGRPKKSEHKTGYLTQGEVAAMFGPPCTAGKVANWEAKARGAKRGSNPPTAIIKGERFYYSEDLRINRTAENMNILAEIIIDYQSRHAIKQNVKDKPKNVHAKNEETLARMQGVAQEESRKLHQNP